MGLYRWFYSCCHSVHVRIFKPFIHSQKQEMCHFEANSTGYKWLIFWLSWSVKVADSSKSYFLTVRLGQTCVVWCWRLMIYFLGLLDQKLKALKGFPHFLDISVKGVDIEKSNCSHFNNPRIRYTARRKLPWPEDHSYECQKQTLLAPVW